VAGQSLPVSWVSPTINPDGPQKKPGLL